MITDFTGNPEVDFNDAWSRVLVIEALKFVTKETSDRIIEKINFNPLLFCEILNLIIEKAADQKAFSSFSLEMLMKTYMSKSWYRKELSFENETLLKGIQLLIKSNPNMNPTTSLINWMIKDNKLTFKACVASMTSYLEKKWEKPEREQMTIEYPNLTSLEIYFKNLNWAPLADTVRRSDVRQYLESLR